MSDSDSPKLDFIREIIADDLATGKHATTITRFPPEPNGYLHIGHAKAICLNFGIALENAESGAKCHLRFDDTNPEKEETEYVESIKEDVRWLGFDWGENLFFASDYFGFFHDCAVHLIKEGKAYVDHQTLEEMRATRGDVNTPGTPSPYRDRTVEENLELFAKMKAGDFKDGECVLRAKIDLASPNMNLRDPVLYRIMHAEHHNTGGEWCIYPMYDFAHPLEDAFEGVLRINEQVAGTRTDKDLYAGRVASILQVGKVIGRCPNVKAVVYQRFLSRQCQLFVDQRLRCRGRRRVWHFQKSRHSALGAGAASSFQIFFVSQSGLAKVNLIVNDARQQIEPCCVNCFVYRELTRRGNIGNASILDQHRGLLDSCWEDDLSVFD